MRDKDGLGQVLAIGTGMERSGFFWIGFKIETAEFPDKLGMRGERTLRFLSLVPWKDRVAINWDG